MMFEFDEKQTLVMCEVLENRLGNLSSEIRHTDSPRVRQELRDERDVLRSVLSMLHERAA